MRNFKILLQYDGTRYQGWQRQVSTDNTIQGKLEALLSKMCGTSVEIQGAGRTDAAIDPTEYRCYIKEDVHLYATAGADLPSQAQAFVRRTTPHHGDT